LVAVRLRRVPVLQDPGVPPVPLVFQVPGPTWRNPYRRQPAKAGEVEAVSVGVAPLLMPAPMPSCRSAVAGAIAARIWKGT